MDLDSWLAGRSRADLERDLKSMVEELPEAAGHVEAQRARESGHPGVLLRLARRWMDRALDVEDWACDEGVSRDEDLDALCRRLEDLREAGEADALLDLGKDLVRRGNALLETSTWDEDPALAGLRRCMDVVFRGVLRSSLPPAGQLLYATDRELEDEFGVAEGAFRVVNRRWPKEVWGEVADELLRRLRAPSAGRAGPPVPDAFRWPRLVSHAHAALLFARRPAEAEALEIEEAGRTGSYGVLCRRLVQEGRLDEAETYARRGLGTEGEDFSSRDVLLEIARRRRNPGLLAAWLADGFFAHPTAEGFASLLAQARRLGKRPAVRAAALAFLETGTPPGSGAAWPIPPLPPWAARPVGAPRPHPSVRLEVALAEGRIDDLLRAHERLPTPGSGSWGAGIDTEVRVARAVAREHPGRALAILAAVVDREIGGRTPGAYEAAGGHLLEMRRIHARLHRVRDWKAHVAALRSAHARKRRLLEVLDGLERRSIRRGRVRRRSGRRRGHP